jgi:hypothetical protein
MTTWFDFTGTEMTVSECVGDTSRSIASDDDRAHLRTSGQGATPPRR